MNILCEKYQNVGSNSIDIHASAYKLVVFVFKLFVNWL